MLRHRRSILYVALGITGCIGAYKSIELMRKLQKLGHDVQAVVTRHGLEFVTPLVLETLSRRPVITDQFQRPGEWEVAHIALARRADVLCVAPATANILAKFARGIADDFLSTLYLSTLSPIVVAPAMNTAMWQHPATRENVSILKDRGVTVVEPDSGYLACGEEGSGRLADLDHIVESVLTSATPAALHGKTVLVTAGPTAEDLDPVRFLTNRSSGKMGFALARIAARRGANVILVAGPTEEPVSFRCRFKPVRSAGEMAQAVESDFGNADIVIMAAAVADYTPARVSAAKIKKSDGGTVLELVRTKDILVHLTNLRRPDQVIVGFAAETEQVEENARKKMAAKDTDIMVANLVGQDAGFGSELTSVSIMTRENRVIRLKDKSKEEIAQSIMDEIEILCR